MVSFVMVASSSRPGFTIGSADAVFSGVEFANTPFDLRSILPPIEFDPTCGLNYVDTSAPTANFPFPDPEFNGVFPGKTQAELLLALGDIGAMCPPESSCNCCVPGGIGCDCLVCQEAVCATDPFCCSVSWDGVCATEATSICSCCPAQDPGVCAG